MATKSIRQSGGDATSITALLNSYPAVLTEPLIIEIDDFDLVDQVLINKTTSPANFIEIRPMPGVTKARVRNGVGATNGTIRFSSLHLRIHGIQVNQESLNGSAGVGPISCVASGAGSDFRLYDVVARDSQATSTSYTVDLSTANLNSTVFNLVTIGAARSLKTNGAASAKIYNSIFWRTAAQMGVVANGEAEIRNCYSGSSVAGAEAFWTGGAAQGSHNASSDTTATTRFPTGSLANVAGASAFASVTSGAEDFRHAASNSILVNAGTTVAGVPADIRGILRPQDGSFDIGAYEYTSVTPATMILISGPTSGVVGVASSSFTATANGSLGGQSVTVVPSDNGGGGVFAPTSAVISESAAAALFTYTAGSVGQKSITVSNNAGLSVPAAITFAVSPAPATALTVQGPDGGQVGAASAPFVVGANGALSKVRTITPSDAGGGGAFNPASAQIGPGAAQTASFVYTAGSAGVKAISFADSEGLPSPPSRSYTAAANPATLRIESICGDSRLPIPGTVIPVVDVRRRSDGLPLVILLNQVLNANSSLVITHAALPAGVPCKVTGWDPADESKAGIWFGTPVGG